MREYYFGVDIGGTTVKIGYFDEQGTMLGKYEIPTRKEDNGEYILSDVADSIRNYMNAMGEQLSQVKGIGIGVPGPVLDDGTVLNCVNLGWGVINIPDKMKALIDTNVKAGNDANMAAVGEMFAGGGKGYSNVVMVTLGTGVGGGIVLDGKMVNGVNGAAGEIGHMPVSYDETDYCTCGKKGCLEQMASATGIVKQTKRLLAKSDRESTLRNIENFSAKDVFDEARAGDQLAKEAVEILGYYLGTALANVSCVVDPDVFVIGGGVSRAGEILIKEIETVYRDKAFNPSKGTIITLATLGNDAGMYGAVKLVLE